MTVRARLTFDLPEDSYSFRCAFAGEHAISALAAVDRRLRDSIKHGDAPRDVISALQEVRDFLRAETEGLPIDE